MSGIPRRVRRMRVGRVFSVLSHGGIDWWLREPRGYRILINWFGVTEPKSTFYPLTDEDWDVGARVAYALSEDESARFLAVVALSGRVPKEYQ